MAEHPSDSELADMGDDTARREEYSLAKPESAPPEAPLPYEVERAMEKATKQLDEDREKPRPVGRFQFTIRDMLVFTTVFAILMGVVASIRRGVPVATIYLTFFTIAIAAWFVTGLWQSGYWRKKSGEDSDSEGSAESRPKEKLLPYSTSDLLLMIAGFAFVMSLTTLLPGDTNFPRWQAFRGFARFWDCSGIWRAKSGIRFFFCCGG